MKLPNGTRKGFFFTVLAVILLSIIVASVATWSSVVASREAKVSENFRLKTLKTALESAGPSSLSPYSQKAFEYALWKIANYSSCNPIRAAGGPAENPDTGVISESLAHLFVNGSVPRSLINPEITYVNEELQYSLSNYSGMLNNSFSPTGILIWLENPRNVSVSQIGPYLAALDYNVTLAAKSPDNAVSVRKDISIHSEVSLEGFVDPLISRGDANFRNVACEVSAKRQVFLHPSIRTPRELAPVLIADENSADVPVSEGKGWFYGNITEIRASKSPEINPSSFSQNILLTSYYEGLATDAQLYGGIILTSAPNITTQEIQIGRDCTMIREEETECLDCLRIIRYRQLGNVSCPGDSVDVYANEVSTPFVVATGNLQSEDLEYTNLEQYAMIDNENDVWEGEQKREGYHRIYNLQKLRDATVCGYYVQSASAPSYFQRMVSTGAYLSSPYGIQTFVLGRWAGGGDFTIGDDYSRVDYKFYQRTIVNSDLEHTGKIKGMPGCKGTAMCDERNDAPIFDGVGKFRLDEDSISEYRLGEIACDGRDRSSCEQ